jgi:hypothetical protein
MIAGQDNDRPCVIAEYLGSALQEWFRLAVIVKGIAGQKNDIGVRLGRRFEHPGKHLQTVTVAEAIVGAEM